MAVPACIAQDAEKARKKRVIPLNVAEQALIAPYLIGKKGTDSVFSPRTAMAERAVKRRENRKTKLTPSQAERDRQRAENPKSRIGEFYNKDSYRVAVLRVIEKANRRLPVDQQIPRWTPYELRHSAASAISVELGGEAATTQLGHTSATTTAIYLHREIEKLTKLAVERMKHNPF